MTTYKIFNYNRAFTSAAQMLALDAETMEGKPKDIAKAVEALATEFAKVQNKYFEKNGLDQESTYDTPSTSPRSKRSSSSKTSSGRKSSGGRTSSKGKGKGLSTAQRGLVNKTCRAIADNGVDFEGWTVEDIEGVYDFAERSQMISENRLWAFYDGDVDEFYDDPKNEDNDLPDKYND